MYNEYVSSPPAGGGGDIDAQIAVAEAEMQAAVSSMQFEKCASLRDRITQLKAEKEAGGGTPIVWVETKLNASVAHVNDLMSQAVAAMQFEKCVEFREAIARLQACKDYFADATNDGEKKAILADMDAIVASVSQ